MINHIFNNQIKMKLKLKKFLNGNKNMIILLKTLDLINK